MKGRGFTPEQIITKMREAETLLSKGCTVVGIMRQMGITEQTYYRWRKVYGGMQVKDGLRVRALEKGNLQPKKLVADLPLDNAILKEVSRETSEPGQKTPASRTCSKV